MAKGDMSEQSVQVICGKILGCSLILGHAFLAKSEYWL